MKVALYLRRSTNEELQADSLTVQEEILRRYANDHDHEVVSVFQDSASGRSIKKRSEFKALIEIVKKGSAPFEAVLVRDVTRWGRFENADEAAYWEFLFFSFGVKVLYVEETFRDDTSPYSTLMKSMKRVLASEFSREKSKAVRYTQARATRNGYRATGGAPYGMKRILVKPSGEVIQTLQKGERKAVGNWRTKLALGDPTEVVVVQRIFTMYADQLITSSDIAAVLNSEGRRAGAGGRWWSVTITGIISNPAYCGTAQYRPRGGRDRRDRVNHAEEDETVKREDCFEPLVSKDLWTRANDVLKSRTWRKTDADLIRELRAAFEKWGFVEAKMLSTLDSPSCWQTYSNRFRDGYREALEKAYSTEVIEARRRIRSLLDDHFEVVDFETGWMINGLLLIGFKYSFPRARLGSLHWEFRFDGTEGVDVTLGFGFSPPPEVRHTETFLLQNSKFRRAKQSIYPNLKGGRVNLHHVRKTDEDLITGLTYSLYWRNTRAEKAFLAAAEGQTMLNVSKLARELGWPESKAQVMHRKLVARGTPLPPLRFKTGRRVEMICPRCSASRIMQPAEALKSKTHLCGECNRFMKSKEKHTLTCPDCGRTRRAYPCIFKKMSGGVDTPCLPCTLKRGRERGRRLQIELTAQRLREKDAVLRLLPFSLQLMKQRLRMFPSAQLWTSRPYPELRWRRPRDRGQCRLTLRCSEEDIEKISSASREDLSLLAETILNRKRWTEEPAPRSLAASYSVTLPASRA